MVTRLAVGSHADESLVEPLKTIHVGFANCFGRGSRFAIVAFTELAADRFGPTNLTTNGIGRFCALQSRFAIRNASAGPAQSRSSVSGRITNRTSMGPGTFKGLFHAHDGSKAALEHRGRTLLD